MTINFNFNLSQKKTTQDKTLWAMKPNREVQFISPDNVMLFLPESQKMQLVTANMLPVLDMLDVFKTKSQHVKDIANAMGVPAGGNGQITQFIDLLIDNGFFWSSEDVKTLAQQGEDNFTTEPPLVVVRTKSRVEMFKRFLLSAVENEARYFGKYHYIVIDDSPAHQAEANLKNLSESELTFSHFDKATRADMLAKLKQQFPEHLDDLDFLLGEHDLHAGEKPYGIAWNWAMLLTAGKSTVFLDDDCMALAFESPMLDGRDVSMVHQNKSTYFLQKQIPLGEQLSAAKIDPIAQLGGALGQSLCHFTVTEASLAGVHTSDVAALSTQSTAMISSQGVAGDTGSDSLLWLFNLDDDSSARLVGQDEESYKQKKRERFMVTGYPAKKISFGDNFSQVARGIDNRSLVPAALPVGRNEDSLFTQMLYNMYPHRFSLDFPWAITHLPEAEREWQDSQLDEASMFKLDTVIRVELEGFSSADTEESNRLMQLVSYLEQRFSGEHFECFAYLHQQESRASMVRMAHDQLAAKPNVSDWWKKDIERIQAANLGADQQQLAPETQANVQAFSLKFLASQRTWVTLWAYSKAHREQWFTH